MKFSFLEPYLEIIHQWIDAKTISPENKTEVIHLLNQAKNGDQSAAEELQDRFYAPLEFGTGGIRGVLGQGIRRLNTPILQKCIQGYGNYLSQKNKDPLVVIAYDSRRFSRIFAQHSAATLSALGIRVYLFPEEQTTPLLSYAVTALQCDGGICITASHNPPEYNGFKIYNRLGGQVIPPEDKEILDSIFKISHWDQLISVNFNQSLEDGLIQYVPQTVIKSYIKKTLELQTYKPNNPINCVYTPLHGTGSKMVTSTLKAWGYPVTIVPEQEKPNGEFPTLKLPNPEDPESFELALKLGSQLKSPILFANDPDADRLALAILDPKLAQTTFSHQSKGDYVFLNGNQIGALFLESFLENSTHKNLDNTPTFLTTIVTSPALISMAEFHKIPVVLTLTGFKWIADRIPHHLPFLFACEESFGYLCTPDVKDKDGISSLCVALEICQKNLDLHKTLCSKLLQIFDKYQSFHDILVNFQFEGSSGKEKMDTLLKKIPSLWKDKALSIYDYKTQKYLHGSGPSRETIPSSSVMEIILLDGSRLILRPSGTEPKLKAYIHASTSHKPSDIGFLECVKRCDEIGNQLKLFIHESH
jgi:phosphoglucomutase